MVSIVSQSETNRLETVREYYICRVASLAGAELAVARAAATDRTLLVTASSPLSAMEVRALDLEQGQVRRREELLSHNS